MKIYIGGDHAGFELKGKLIPFLENLGYEVIDKGAFELNQSDDYPDYIKKVAGAVAESPEPVEGKGIIIGGSGQGEAICANRISGVRAIVFYSPRLATKSVDVAGRSSDDPYEVIRLAREHNDANILSLGARFLTEDEAERAVKIFLETPFSGDERHVRRLKKIDD